MDNESKQHFRSLDALYRHVKSEYRSLGIASPGIAPGIVDGLAKASSLLSRCTRKVVAGSDIVVAVLSPGFAAPVGSAPGATGTSSDSTAALAGDPMTLKPWYSTVSVAMGALIGTTFEADYPAILLKAFAAAIDKAILIGTGTGSDALGVFTASPLGVTTSQDVACGAAGAPTWADVQGIAADLLATGADPASSAIVMSPAILEGLLASASTGAAPTVAEYSNSRTILGLPVILSANAPSVLTAGSYVLVAGNFSGYVWASSSASPATDLIKTVGSDIISFQSHLYMQGKPVIADNFLRLKTV